MTWGLFAVLSFELVNAYFVGQLGTTPLAAMSFTFPVAMVLSSIAIGLGAGASSVIARAIGEGDARRVRRLTTDSLLLAVLVVGAAASLGLATIDPLFTALGAGPEVLPYIRDYMEIWYFGMVFLVVPMVGNGALRASGDTLFPGVIMTVAGGVNLLLDPILIFGLLGAPRLELRGAAIATVLARATTLVAALVILHLRYRMLTRARPSLAALLASWRAILHVGLPAAAAHVIVPVSMGIVTRLLADFGPAAVAGFGVATRVEAFSVIPLLALSAVIGPFVGQNSGARRWERVHDGLGRAFAFALVWGAFVAGALLLGARALVAHFSASGEVVATAVAYLHLVPLSYGAYGVLIVGAATFNGLGRPLPASLLVLARMFALYVPLAFLGRHLAAVPGVFGAAVVANVVGGFAAWRLARHHTDMRAREFAA
jgi:putative MATE family efflux protein